MSNFIRKCIKNNNYCGCVIVNSSAEWALRFLRPALRLAHLLQPHTYSSQDEEWVRLRKMECTGWGRKAFSGDGEVVPGSVSKS